MQRRVVERREIELPPLPPGSESSLGVVDKVFDDGSVQRMWTKDDGVQVIALTPDGRVIAVHEHGYTHLVGGYVEPGEDPEATARRELLEEASYEAGNLELLARTYHDSGSGERTNWLYLATNCSPSTKGGEQGIEAKLMSLEELWELLSRLEPDSTKPRKGLVSIAVMVLTFRRLGFTLARKEGS